MRLILPESGGFCGMNHGEMRHLDKLRKLLGESTTWCHSIYSLNPYSYDSTTWSLAAICAVIAA